MKKFKDCHSERSEKSELSSCLKFRFFVSLRYTQNDNFGHNSLLKFLFLISIIFILHPSSCILAQHTRLYACALGSDDPSAFMGGSSIGGGLWQSDDTGKTWKQLGWEHVKCYSVDVVNKSNGKIIYQACGNGVLKSTDAGATWKMMTDWRVTEVMDIAVDQKKPNNIYIATPGAIWKSDDGGDNWYEADSDMPQPIFVSRIKIDPSDHLKIYAATELGLYESKDGGLSWNKRSGSGESVRDMIVTSHGLSAWIEESGNLHYFENKKWNMKAGSKNSRTLIWYKKNFARGSGAIHSFAIIGDDFFTGSLNGGVWEDNPSEENKNSGEEYTSERSGLNKLQIWRLKTVEIK